RGQRGRARLRRRIRRRRDRRGRPDRDQSDRVPAVGPRLRIDLPTHRTASDGLLAPSRLVMAARERAVTTLALTDHDTTDGLAEALAAGQTCGVDVIPGVEINTDVGEHEAHILGYFVDHTRETLQAFLLRMREGRLRRAEEMVRRLAALGYTIEWPRVVEIAAGASVGRPHVARALVEAG